MQMHSVETNAGNAISWAPSRIAWIVGLPSAIWRWTFSNSTVASSTRIPTASANPPSVMRLIVSPNALRTASDTRIESGIESAMMTVPRHEPRNKRIMIAVKHAAITPSRTTPEMAARTNID